MSLLALTYREDIEEFNFNLFVGNSLEFNWFCDKSDIIRANEGFDIIIGNPPYVRSKNIDSKSKELLKFWETSKIGNAIFIHSIF